jgi:UDP-2,3-diacylglucosamine pyrophosphatase LpxH
VPLGETKQKFLLISDLHWDNPHCKLDLLKKHLDQAKKENAKVIINGDLFCLMQGKGDPRRSKEDIRPEHNNSKYLDSIIKTAADWFEPYIDVLTLVGYGNHETTIIKHQETDILERFVERINTIRGNKSEVYLGGYGGWFVTRFTQNSYADCKKATKTHKIKYHHGYGGGGPVTKGTIQHQREAVKINGADIIWMGHVHEHYQMTYSVEYLNHIHEIRHKDITMLRTASYKEEYGDGHHGFHIEKGRPVKPLGGCWLELEYKKVGRNYIVNEKLYKTDQNV